MHYPHFKEFRKLSQKGNLIPVYREIFGDLDTPVSAYFKVAQKAKYSFLLESVEGEEKVARFSFLAKDPEIILKIKDHTLEIIRKDSGAARSETRRIEKSPLNSIREIMSRYRLVRLPDLPRFCGGMVGYVGYDIVRFFERLPDKPQDDLKLPDTILLLAKDLIIFDHLNHKIKVVSCAQVDPKSSFAAHKKEYEKAVKKIDELVAQIHQPLLPVHKECRVSKSAGSKIHSNYTPAQFKGIVTAAKKDIRKGEIIQAVLSQRFTMPIHTDPFNVYRALRSLNPSPYMYYLNFDGMQIIGSSPELLVRCEDKIIATRPVAGTRPRGKDERQDGLLSRDLLNDPKEKAEHIMLVDLGRNDLGRVSEKGSVKVTEFMGIEKYSHVMHIVSNVQGTLKKGKDSLDVLEAAFPAGTVSGAPKIRAMEIIDRLENVSRGPYAGCIGYFSFSGNLDTCITIRTIIVRNGKAYIQAGAGIVAESNPEKEYQETVQKAQAQVTAIRLAHSEF
ncbi:MAG: anthranilate synthase component I [Candidatus Omnitrophota bacterium]